MLDEIHSTPDSESDENLRAVYGDDATFSRVGLFTLVHLDGPTPEIIVRRTREFDPREFFVDDCPLCQASRNQGGHIVFSGSKDEDPDDDGDGDSTDDPGAGVHSSATLGPSAVALVRALDRLDISSDDLVRALEPIGSAGMLRHAIETVGFLHDRIADIMWDEDPATRLPTLESTVVAALETLATVRAEHPGLDALAESVEVAIEGVSTGLRTSFERSR